MTGATMPVAAAKVKRSSQDADTNAIITFI
jgi:hypothetical protein